MLLAGRLISWLLAEQICQIWSSALHEGPLWHDDNEVKYFSAAAFSEGMEAVSTEEFEDIQARAGIEDHTSCAIHGDVAFPDFTLLQILLLHAAGY